MDPVMELFEERHEPKNFGCSVCEGSVLGFCGGTSHNSLLFGAPRDRGGTEINYESSCGDVSVPVTSPVGIGKGM